jgi:predicted RNase H-like nuclease (RuvC/YqgF family)
MTTKPDFINDNILQLKDSLKNNLETLVDKQVVGKVDNIKESYKNTIIPTLAEKARADMMAAVENGKKKIQEVEDKNKKVIEEMRAQHEKALKEQQKKTEELKKQFDESTKRYEKLSKEVPALKNKALLYDLVSSPSLSENQKIKLTNFAETKYNYTHKQFKETISNFISGFKTELTTIKKVVDAKNHILPKKENMMTPIAKNIDPEMKDLYVDMKDLMKDMDKTYGE